MDLEKKNVRRCERGNEPLNSLKAYEILLLSEGNLKV
jgi:hypothetical protein